MAQNFAASVAQCNVVIKKSVCEETFEFVNISVDTRTRHIFHCIVFRVPLLYYPFVINFPVILIDIVLDSRCNRVMPQVILTITLVVLLIYLF